MKKEKEKKKKHLKHTVELLSLEDLSEMDCTSSAPLKIVVDAIGGKWKIRILWALKDQTGRRYSEIKNDIDGITDMMLSQSLRELTEFGLIARHQYQEIPPRVEYHITEEGIKIIPALHLLVQWAKKRAENP